MNSHEIAAVLGYLGAAFRTEVEPATAKVYAEHLAGQRADDAERAMRRIVKTNQHFPRVSEFLATCRMESERRPDAYVQALPSGERTEFERAAIARWHRMCQELLASQRAAPHNHHGPLPCPACGGIAPKARAALAAARSNKP